MDAHVAAVVTLATHRPETRDVRDTKPDQSARQVIDDVRELQDTTRDITG